MAWWADLTYPDTLGGIVAAALVVTVVLLALALGLAFAWQKWKEGRKAAPKAR